MDKLITQINYRNHFHSDPGVIPAMICKFVYILASQLVILQL